MPSKPLTRKAALDVTATTPSGQKAMPPRRTPSSRGKKASALSSSSSPKYSVLLPTYNERENIGLIVWLLVQTFEEQ